MPNFKEVRPEDPSYDDMLGRATPRNKPLNYRVLAQKILDADKGTIIEVYSPKKVHSNIKRGLMSRGIEYGVHYDMTFSTDDNEEVYYITIKG